MSVKSLDGNREYTPQARETELPLFNQLVEQATKVKGPDKPDHKELVRVTGRLAETILLFWAGLQPGEEFHASDLHQFVAKRLGTAPASADRIMRKLRSTGQVEYELADRSKSLYRKVA